ncbi:hypothetical protein QJR26_18170 (plasmid) [Clostridium baratii]
MKKNIKSLIIITLGLMLCVFTKTYYCSAKTLDVENKIPVTGRIIFGNNEADNKDDVQGIFPIKPPFNSDNNLIDIPKTGYESNSIYLIILILGIMILIWQYVRTKNFEKEELRNEKAKNDTIG